MLAGSPTAFLLWAILACLFAIFLVVHLWLYDRFRCLSWRADRRPGNFRRIMTYCYVCTVPLLVLYSISMTIVKQKEGYMFYDGEMFPRPPELWRSGHKGWVVPLNFVVSFIWVLECSIHLEELTFWLFLLHQGPTQRDWFTSWEFRLWQIGSYVALLALPTIALVTRRNLSTGDAWIFLVGASAALLTTLCFLHVLARFPSFLRAVKSGGAAPDVVQRLRGFYRLNLVRVGFRFLFTVPLLAISIDALTSPLAHDLQGLEDAIARHGPSILPLGWRSAHPIVGDPFITDFMLMLGGIGCFVSSGITLVIFFPADTATATPPPTPQADPETSQPGSHLARAPSSATIVHPKPTSSDSQRTSLEDGHALSDVHTPTSYHHHHHSPTHRHPYPYPHSPPWSPLDAQHASPSPSLELPARPSRAAAAASASMSGSVASSSGQHHGPGYSPTLARAPSLYAHERASLSPTLYVPPAEWGYVRGGTGTDGGTPLAGGVPPGSGGGGTEYFRRAAAGVDPRAGGAVHPFVASFRSPIDLYDDGEPRAL